MENVIYELENCRRASVFFLQEFRKIVRFLCRFLNFWSHEKVTF